MIKLRIDVDYPYPSRIKSFISTLLDIQAGNDYLRNPKIVARMINESPEDIKAYWFFTPITFPDEEMLRLLSNSRHEIALHVVKDPNKELETLGKIAGKKVNYYTIHGTSSLVARFMWRRWQFKVPTVPQDFPLESFHSFPVCGLDLLCYTYGEEQVYEIAKSRAVKGDALHIHPIWLFQRGKMNRRGPFYRALRRILNVDNEFETVAFRKKTFFTIAADVKEYEKDVIPTERFIEKLRERRADIFTFIERKWCSPIPNPPKSWVRASDNIALMHVTTYDKWWESIGKKTRNMIRKAEKSGIKIELAGPNEKLAEGIWKIYNETPIRQERGFPHYGTPLEAVKSTVLSSRESTYIGACLQDELVGFAQLVYGDKITILSQILSLQKHWDKAVNNALIAKAVEFCANKRFEWLMYGRMGNHPTLDKFKQNNGFSQYPLTRHFIPLTRKGRIATRLGLHREIKDALPQSIKYRLIPIYNWVSRTKMKIKARSKTKPQS